MPVGLDGNPNPVSGPAREALLREVARDIVCVHPTGRILVGIDGAPGSGKSTFADELAAAVIRAGRPGIRSTTDSFHNPRAVRYQQGRTSGEGYYRDSHDLDAIRLLLLKPFSRGQAYRVAVFDEPTDRPVDVPDAIPPESAVLIFDGLFLQRAELREFWRYSIFLRADERRRQGLATAEGRMSPEVFAGYQERYVGGWNLYLQECSPEARATRVILNDDFAAPRDGNLSIA